MRLFTLPVLWAAALFSAVVVIPFLFIARQNPEEFSLDVRLASSAAGHVQVYYDSGSGFSEKDSTALDLAAGATPRLYRLALPPAPTGPSGSTQSTAPAP